MNNFIFLSGLPRAGSTLLSAIFSQNPNIHAEGNSAVCQLMWDMQQSCYEDSKEQLVGNNRFGTIADLVSEIPNIYYKNVVNKTILDKCRSWSLPDNLNLIKNYITTTPKIIILERPLVDVVRSFVAIRIANNFEGNPEFGLLDDWSEPIMRSFNGVKWAKENNNGEFLIVQYDNLINNTKEIIDSIYSFCELETFSHDFNNIVNIHPENDESYNMIGLHDIRPTISKRFLDITLSQETIDRCLELDK
jgi:sulfotransferase